MNRTSRPASKTVANEGQFRSTRWLQAGDFTPLRETAMPYGLPLDRRRRHPESISFRGSMAGLHLPLPTLRRHPRGCLRTAWGRCGSLYLHRSGLAPPTPCRSPGAPVQKFDRFRSRRLAVVEIEHSTKPLAALHYSVKAACNRPALLERRVRFRRCHWRHPHNSESFGPTMRATLSSGPPAAYATIQRICFAG
jgi:hypothetical protein